MKKSSHKSLLSDVLRPQTVSEMIVPPSVEKTLQRFVTEREMMNVTFYGSPGIGKTSATKILVKELDLGRVDEFDQA